MTTTIYAEGLGDLSGLFRGMPEITSRSARLAINQVADRVALPQSRTEIQRQVAFPEGYLDDDRLGVRKRATNADLSAMITGRDRPTSLARFVVSGNKLGEKSAITVMVKPGVSKTFRHPDSKPSAWLIRLRSGASITEDNFNIGLAIRLKAGATIHGTSGAKEIFPNVWLLYGPSIGQVFRNVADQVSPDVLEALQTEFLRQFNRNAGL